jgi:acetyltransferase-like isoleucine patch superfamily enzyme/ubiquinone/menaquinone biosynthesis C-methylase UbiE
MKSVNRLKELLGRMRSRNRLRDLDNRKNLVSRGKNTFIDPGVIVDQPPSIKIGSQCVIRKGVVLRPEDGEIIIGDHCVINHYTVFHGKGGVYLGDWTVIGPHCGFYAQNHSYERFDIPISQQKNVGKGIYLMGDNWIGSHSVICDDVTLGKGAIVGANSTVTKSVPMGSIVMGSPARVVKKRYTGSWDFNKVERATLSSQMPSEIRTHVERRGQRIREMIVSDDKVLDVGCGEGIITAILAEKCPSIIGCDYSLEALRMAKEKYQHITFMYSNSTTLRFDDESFTKAVLSDVAEHLLPQQFVKTLKEIRRVLVEDGILILTTPLTSRGTHCSTYAHIYEYSRDEVESILLNMFSHVELLDVNFGVFVCRK